jgi:hypothetical protein
LSDARLITDAYTPLPLRGFAEWDVDGVTVHAERTVESYERVNGQGMVAEPLVVTPSISVSIAPNAQVILPTTKELEVTVHLHSETASEGELRLKLPEQWKANPEKIAFKLERAGAEFDGRFTVTPAVGGDGVKKIAAVATAGGRESMSGWRKVGYAGITPSFLYEPARLRVRAVDAASLKGLKVGYVMGTGDEVPDAVRELGAEVHLLSDAELGAADLSAYDSILVGIRAYSNRGALRQNHERLMSYVKGGGNLVVQYQSEEFPAAFPLVLGDAEKVVEEQAKVVLLEPENAILRVPNRISEKDFDGWVEERGHSFLKSWDEHYSALLETGDAGQAAQRGGLLVANYGKGRYTYVAFALYRQLPELVGGAYRLLGNLLSK